VELGWEAIREMCFLRHDRLTLKGEAEVSRFRRDAGGVLDFVWGSR
jgi:hypothetical protein